MQERRIPTLIGFAVIVAGLGATVFGVQQFSAFRTRASSSVIPKEVTVTNVGDQGFSVTWLTDAPAVGFITYGPTQELGINAEDDRKDNQQYVTHHISVQGLEASTKYYFKVGSAANLFDQDGAAFEVTTASANDNSKRDIISGFIMKEQNAPAVDALVTVTIKDSVPLSTLTNKEGQYRIDLAQARDKNSFNQLSYNPTTDFIDVKVKLPPEVEATATTTTANSHPIPPITLGAINDFTQTEQPKPTSDPATITPEPQSAPSGVTTTPAEPANGTAGYEKSRSLLLPSSTSPTPGAASFGPSPATNPPGSLINQQSLDALGL